MMFWKKRYYFSYFILTGGDLPEFFNSVSRVHPLMQLAELKRTKKIALIRWRKIGKREYMQYKEMENAKWHT